MIGSYTNLKGQNRNFTIIKCNIWFEYVKEIKVSAIESIG